MKIMPQNPPIYKDPFFWIALVSGGFILTLTLWFGIGVDTATISYCSWVWKTHGLPPYVGCIEGDYPGIFVIHRLVLELLGDSVLDFRVFNLVIQLAALVMVFYLARRFSGLSPAGLLSALFYATYYYRLDYYNAGQREEYVLWLVILSVIIGLVLKQRFYLRALLVGLLVSFAFLIKPTFGLLWPVFGTWFLLEGIKTRPRAVWLEMALFSLGCFLPIAIVVLYYWQLGYIRDLYQIPVWYIFNVYGKRPVVLSPYPFDKVIELNQWSLLAYQLKSITRENSLVLVGGLFTIILQLFMLKQKPGRTIIYIFLGLILACFISVYLQRGIWGYHRVPFWGLMIILAGWGWAWFFQAVKDQRPSKWRDFLAPALALGLIVMIFFTVPKYLRSFAARHAFRDLKSAYFKEYKAQEQAADFIKAQARPQDQIYYFGTISQLPFLAGKKLPVPLPFTDIFFWEMKDGAVTAFQLEWKKKYIDTFFKTRPRFFIFDTATPVALYNPPPESYRPVFKEQLPEIQKALDREYHLVEKFGAVEIYELNPDGPSPGNPVPE